jgi:hypothetical protein
MATPPFGGGRSCTGFGHFYTDGMAMVFRGKNSPAPQTRKKCDAVGWCGISSQNCDSKTPKQESGKMMAVPMRSFITPQLRQETCLFSIESEKSVLGGMLVAGIQSQTEVAWAGISNLTEPDFYHQDHRLIFRAIAGLAGNGQPTDITTVSTWLEQRGELTNVGGFVYLATLAKDTPSAANIRAYADAVQEMASRRKLVGLARKIEGEGLAGKPIDDLLSDIRQLARTVTARAKPLPDDDRTAVQTFDPDLLPESVRGFVMDTADRMQAPVDFLAITAMVAAGGLVGRKILMKPKQLDNWAIAPNLWAACVGRPSAMKSPAISAALQPIRNIEQERQATHRELLKDLEIQTRFLEAGAKDRKKQWASAAKSGDKEFARMLMAEEEVQETPPPPRLTVNNATTAKLGELLAQSNNGLLLERDELAGWLANLNAKDGGEDRAFYLELYDRLTPYTHDRIERGTIRIESPILSIIGGIQPSKIAGVVRGAISGESDDGLIQRFQLMVWPDNEESFSYRDRAPEPQAYAAYMGIMRGLSEIPPPEEDVPAWRFTDRAQAAFVEWYTSTMRRARSGDMGSALESHLIKSPKAIAGLALLLELIGGGNSGQVGEVATIRALAWAEYLESHARRVYSAGTANATTAARVILDNKAKLQEVFTAREIWKKGWKGVVQDVTEDALDLLIDCGYLMTVSSSTGASGRPTTRFTWRA